MSQTVLYTRIAAATAAFVLMVLFGAPQAGATSRGSDQPELEAGAAPAWLEATFSAMRIVETGGERRPSEAEGDGGRSIGPYQISRPYWIDAGVEGKYAQVRDRQYAERVILAYWRRYAPEALATRDVEVLVRIHNGGPRGHRKAATRTYWRKIQLHLR